MLYTLELTLETSSLVLCVQASLWKPSELDVWARFLNELLSRGSFYRLMIDEQVIKFQNYRLRGAKN